MRIGIDARLFGSSDRGIGRYTEEILLELEKQDTSNEYTVFLSQTGYEKYQPQSSNFKKVLADFRPYTRQEQFSFLKLLNSQKCDLVHFMHWNAPMLYSGRYTITIHDLFYDVCPDLAKQSTLLFPWKFFMKKLFYKIQLTCVLNKSEKIITLNTNTKKDIQKFYKISAEKITIIHNGVTQTADTINNDKELRSRYNISRPFILSVGASYPHKNLKNTILAFDMCNTKDYEYLLIGKIDNFYRNLIYWMETNHLSERIRCLGEVSDAELTWFYSNSELLLFPSLYEGFGLPVVEALSHGTPVLASDIASTREIVGSDIVYFIPTDIRDIAKKLEVSLQQKLRPSNEVIEKILKKYSWEKTARQLLDLFAEIFSNQSNTDDVSKQKKYT